MIKGLLSGFKAAVVFGLVLLSINSVQAGDGIGVMGDDGVLHVNALDADRLLKKNPKIIVLDVRTGQEFKQGHIKGAINLNYYDNDFKELVRMLDQTETYLVHCKTGRRSGLSIPIMKAAGFKNLAHMDHGFDGWRKAGLAISTN
ncbi:MAG: rhodanese-like domain-containing protein [Sneathiella sp.]